MKKQYTALEDFESPICGAVKRDDPLSLPEDVGARWTKSGLVEEVIQRAAKQTPRKKEVKGDGRV